MRATSATDVGRGASGEVRTTSSAMRCRKMCATATPRMPAASRVSAATPRMTAAFRGGGRTNHAH
jgi:hypothetical protein